MLTVKVISQLRATREAWGLSVQDLAEIMHVTPRALYAWEARERTPTVAALTRWANALAMDIEAVRRK